MYQWICLLTVVVYTIVGGYVQLGNYTTYKCTQPMFTLHCAATAVASITWTICANNQCKVIYQRNADNIVIRNRYVFENGTLHDTCTNKHGWVYMCTIASNAQQQKTTWGIDVKGVNTCK